MFVFHRIYRFQLFLNQWIMYIFLKLYLCIQGNNQKCREQSRGTFELSSLAQCSQLLMNHLPSLWWKLHTIGPQALPPPPRLLNMKQLPFECCWSLHPHTNESFTSTGSLCVSACVWEKTSERVLSMELSQTKRLCLLRLYDWSSKWKCWWCK